MAEPEHEYVDLMLTVEKGQIVSCEFHGEGRQIEPVADVAVFLPIDSDPNKGDWIHGARRVARWIEHRFRKMAAVNP